MATKKKTAKKQADKGKKPRAAKAKKAVAKKAVAKKAVAKKAVAKKAVAKKAVAKKAVAKKAVAKKAVAKKAVAKKAVVTRVKKPAVVEKKVAVKAATKRPAAPKPFKRRDATGHLNPEYARDLRRNSLENAEKDDDRAFLVGDRANDALANELGREFVETVTSGEDEGNELRDRFVSEEIGGPFVTTTRGQEVDEQPDESNPKGATREPFPKS